VGEPVLADVDGDGRAEILVPTESGQLHCLRGLKQRPRWTACRGRSDPLGRPESPGRHDPARRALGQPARASYLASGRWHTNRSPSRSAPGRGG